VAKQTHRIVTVYEKRVPVSAADRVSDDEEEDAEDGVSDLELPAVVVEDEPYRANDAISQMLADLQIDKRAHSWTMVVERLPNYPKDGRYDVQAKRVNCGTRAMSTEFVEEIRREFARPGKANDFRITIKRDGKIYAHWPEVLSLEPPPPAEMQEFDQQTNPTPAVMFAPSPAAPTSFQETIKQMKALAELRDVLFPQTSSVASVTQPPLTDEGALIKLLASDSQTLERITSQLSQRLFPAVEASEDSWLPVIKSLVDNGPGIVRELFSGIQSLRQPQPSSSSTSGTTVTGVPVATMPTAAVSPEIQLLGRVIEFCAQQTAPTAVAAFVEQFAAQNPTVDPIIDLFVELSVAECQRFLTQYVPQAKAILDQPHAAAWLTELQQLLKTPEVQHAGAAVS
jgi:hypothetical protein